MWRPEIELLALGLMTLLEDGNTRLLQARMSSLKRAETVVFELEEPIGIVECSGPALELER